MASYFCTFRSSRSPPRKRAALPTPNDASTSQVPFRSANPEQLQEVTLGTQLEYPEGGAPAFLRSTAGYHSPIRTRTMKEYDQQIAELKKENFSLKLRIYFLEERWEHEYPNSSQDIFKSNIELKVEVESLKKELSDKQELLVKASNALEALEASHQSEIEDLKEQFANQRLALEQQVYQFQQAVAGFHPEKPEQGNSDDQSQSQNHEPVVSAVLGDISEIPSKQHPLFEELNAKILRLESEVEQLNKDLSQSHATAKKLEKIVEDKEAVIKEEYINNIKRNKLIQGLVETVKTKDKELVQIQEKCDLQEDELKQLKSELNENIKHLEEKSRTLETFASNSNKPAVPDTVPDKDALEDLRREKERLEAAWRDAVSQRDETIQTLQADLQQQLQYKEDQILKLKQIVEDRETVLADCLQLVGGIGLEDLEAAKDLTVHGLSVKLKSILKEKENSVQAVLEDKLKLLKEKDNELTQLRESLKDRDQSENEKFLKLEETREIINKLQFEVQERDAKIQELMDTVQNLYKQVKEIHESNSRTIAEKDTIVQRLQKSLAVAEKKIEIFKNESIENSEQQQSALLMTSNDTEITVTQALSGMAEKDKVKHSVSESSSSQNQEQEKIDILKLKSEILSLQTILQQKEDFLVYLKDYLENLLNDTASPNEISEVALLNSVESSLSYATDTSYLEQKLADLKARLKDSRARNQQLEDQLAAVKNRIAILKPNQTDKEEDEMNMLCDSGDTTFTIEKQQMPEKVIALKSSEEYHSKIPKATNLSNKEGSPLKKSSLLSKSQPVLLDRRLGKSGIPVRLKSGNQLSRGSNQNNYFAQYQAAKAEIQSLSTKLTSTENTVHVLGMKLKYYRKLLQDAGIAPLASPGSKSMFNLLPATSLASEGRLSLSSSSYLKQSTSFNRRSVSAEDLRFSSAVLSENTQALSAEDVLTTQAVSISSEKKIVSEKSTVVRKTSNETLHLCIKLPTSQDNNISPQTNNNASVEEKEVNEKASLERFKRIGMEIPLTPIVIDLKKEDNFGGPISSPYTPDSVVDYGQSNDTLELKEQICRLKLQLDQRDAELQILRCSSTKELPFSEKEKNTKVLAQCFRCLGISEDANASNHSPFILQEQMLPPSVENTPQNQLRTNIESTAASVSCLDEEESMLCRESNDQDLLDALAAEIEHLQDKNISLNSKLESLIHGIPEGKLKRFIQLQQEEVMILKNRLLESHNACEMLRGRLEELADFLEHLLQFDENGLLDTSQLTPQRIASLHRCIAQSRELSQSLSQSLLVDVDISILSNVDKTKDNTSMSLPFPECNMTSDDEHPLPAFCRMQAQISKALESSLSLRSLRNSHLDISRLTSQSFHDLQDKTDSNVNLGFSGSHFNKIYKENCEKSKLIGKLRAQVKVLQDQIRQRDIENAWNNLDNTITTEASHLQYPAVGDNQFSKMRRRTSSGNKDKLLFEDNEIIPVSQSLSSIEGKPCPVVSADREFIWQTQIQDVDNFSNEAQKIKDPSTPANHSSCDDLILLLRAERDIPSHQSATLSHHSQEPNTENGHLADELANCEMRTLEALQEQAIMAEYVRHYTTRQFLDEDIHHRVPQNQEVSAHDSPEKEKPMKMRSRHLPSPSDSDSWSEPDRDVSQQRMGIEPEDRSTSLMVDRTVSSWCSLRHHHTKNKTSKTNSSSGDSSQLTGSRVYRAGTSPGVSKSHGEQKEVRRLQSQLQSLEELNATLRSELQIYQTINSTNDVKKPFEKTQDALCHLGMETVAFSKGKPARRKSTGSASSNQTQITLQEHLAEIRILRSHLEASIKNNDQLREKLEQKLSFQQEIFKSGKSVELDKLYEKLQQKEQEASDLQEQLEYYRKLVYTNRKSEQENNTRQQQQLEQINELKEHIQNTQGQLERLQRELSDREQASSELKQAMQRLQGSTLHLQTALSDKDHVNRELREANLRMQRTLDNVDQLMSQREKEIQNIISQRDKLKISMQELMKKQEVEMCQLNKKLNDKEKVLSDHKKALDSLSEVNTELRRNFEKSQEEIHQLHKSLIYKEEEFNKECKKMETVQLDLSKKAQEIHILQKKCDDLMLALSETEHLLEQEHGLSLTLQQKVNTLTGIVSEKENISASLHQKTQDLTNQLHSERNNGNELKKSIDEYKIKQMESQHQITMLKDVIEKLKMSLTDKKREQELQMEKVQMLDKKLKELNASAKDLEIRFQKERNIASKLQEQNEVLKKQASTSDMERNSQRASCEKLRQKLHEQETIYFDLQSKLDERSATIHKLEEEIHRTAEENFVLQQEILSQQSKIKEAAELNKSMKTELNVYEHLHASMISQRNASNPDKVVDTQVKKLHLEELLEEIRNLRTQLELSIQTNNALRSQLEEQFKAELKAFSSVSFSQELKDTSHSASLNVDKAVGEEVKDTPVTTLSLLKNSDRSCVQKDVNSSLQTHLMDLSHAIQTHHRTSKNSERNKSTSGIESSLHSWNEMDGSKIQVKKNSGKDNHTEGLKEDIAIPTKKQLHQFSQSSDYISDPAVDEYAVGASVNIQKVTVLPEGSCIDREMLPPGSSPHSMYSSPDLGIESDPNHFSSLERKHCQALREIKQTTLTSSKNIPSMDLLYSVQEPFQSSDIPKQWIDSDKRLLFAIGRLDDYELLKKEVEESIIVLKGIQARIKERMKSYSSSSPLKNMEYITLKELHNGSNNLQICLGKSSRIIGLFWTAMLPSSIEENDENHKLIEENTNLKKKLRQQKKTLQDAFQKLAASNRLKEGMEKAIVKQLTKTHDVLKKAKGNLTDQAVVGVNG